jgi:serine/threonine protein kinase
MKDAVEMAVLSSIQHPNIVQVFTCLTDCVDVGGSASKSLPGSGLQPSTSDVAAAAAAAAAGAPGHKSAPLFRTGTGIAPRFRRLLPFEDPEDIETCSIIVMEVGDDHEGGLGQTTREHAPASDRAPGPAPGAPPHPSPPLPASTLHPRSQYCDLGTLRHNLAAGRFHVRLPPPDGAGRGVLAVDLAAILDAALEVAEAVAYLHSIRLVHCDVKLDNVLLKSSPAQPRGYIAKLGDFGLAKVLGAADATVNVCGAGTVNHLAPELFVAGSRVSPAVDAYAFGVLLWELYMGGVHAYAGLSQGAIVDRVRRGMRPRFPPGVPTAYADLAAACMAADPSARPSMGAVIACLQAMADEAAAGAE